MLEKSAERRFFYSTFDKCIKKSLNRLFTKNSYGKKNKKLPYLVQMEPYCAMLAHYQNESHVYAFTHVMILIVMRVV